MLPRSHSIAGKDGRTGRTDPVPEPVSLRKAHHAGGRPVPSTVTSPMKAWLSHRAVLSMQTWPPARAGCGFPSKRADQRMQAGHASGAIRGRRSEALAVHAVVLWPQTLRPAETAPDPGAPPGTLGVSPSHAHEPPRATHHDRESASTFPSRAPSARSAERPTRAVNSCGSARPACPEPAPVRRAASASHRPGSRPPARSCRESGESA